MFLQRFGVALNVHFHTLMLEGVYAADEFRRIRFCRLPPPDDAEVAGVTARIARRIVNLLERRGLGPHGDPEEADPLQRDQPLLAELYGASVHGRIAEGPRAGHRVMTLGGPTDLEAPAVTAGARCASVAGFSVHANVCIPARARRQLEKLCLYAARPPMATARLSLLTDDQLLYRPKRRWRDGTTHVLFEPIELVEDLAAYGILVRESFRRVLEKSGKVLEQIDGVIEIDADTYLVEAKWLVERVGVEDVSRHLVRVFTRDYTRGILISATEYTEPAIETCRDALSKAVVVVCTLEQIILLFERDGDLIEFLKTKIHAAVIDKKPTYSIQE